MSNSKRLRAKKAATLLMIAGMLGAAVTPASACGPFFSSATLVETDHPDFPLRKFASGHLGLIQGGLARSYLVMAYRYLTDKPLTADEQNAALSVWHRRLNSDSSSYDQPASSGDWTKARDAILKDKAACEIESFRNVSDDPDAQWQQYQNCNDDSYAHAAAVLKQRAEKFGASSAQIKDWIKAQDLVFCHCGSPGYDYNTKKVNPEKPYPQPLPDSADPLLRYDRDYQIAAANFYGQHYDKALAEFQKISADSNSPWHDLALYMVARTQIRQGSIANNKAAYTAATKDLNAILSNPKLEQYHKSARDLLSFVAFRAEPDQRLHELSAALQNSSKNPQFANNLIDYTWLYDNMVGWSPDGENTQKEYKAIPPALQKDNMSDWIASMQAPNGSAFAHAQQRWEQTKAAPWLIAALTNAAAEKSPPAQSAALIAEAEKMAPTSPGYLTANYAAALLLIHKGDRSAARTKIDQLLKTADLAPSARNALLNAQMQIEDSFKEFMTLAVRTPANIAVDDGMNADLPDDFDKLEQGTAYKAFKPVFADDAAKVMNQKLPLSLLVDGAKDSSVPKDLRANLAQSAWTRAFLLDNKPALDALTPIVSSVQPTLAPFLKGYAAAKSAEEKRFAGYYLLVKFPGIRPYVDANVGRTTPLGSIDDYQDNWWCAGGGYTSEWQNTDAAKKEPLVALKFLTPADVSAATAENAKLKALGTAPNLLANQITAYGKTHLTDPRLPEALALAVKATRFGCKDAATGKASKQAFDLLHSKFPGNAWTKKTPYWYQ